MSLAARPRNTEHFSPGARVAYWRTQKSHEGKLEHGGRWHGPAVVLGNVGQDIVVIHKRNIFRCAPEQVRLATSEERALMDTPDVELLGIKNLIQNNALQSRQYVDLVRQLPPETTGNPGPTSDAAQDAEPPNAEAVRPVSAPVSGTASTGFRSSLSDVRTENHEISPTPSSPDSQPRGDTAILGETASTPETVPEEYGPARRVRMRGKARAELLHRSRAMLQDDFQEMMQEVVPQLLSRALQRQSAVLAEGALNVSVSEDTSGSVGDLQPRGVKREASSEPPAVSSPKRSAPSTNADPPPMEEDALLVQHFENLLVSVDRGESSIEALVAAHFQKRQSKELPATGNPAELQYQVQESKGVEWHTIQSRNATRVILGKEAEMVRRKFADRIMGSRFVMTVKQEEAAPARVKARWCLQGHLDPDLRAKAEAGDLQSPTLSQVGRATLFQLIASHKWRLRLGDIKGAFLSSGELPPQYRPLYARLPPGGIPGVPSNALIEVIGHIYGLNSAPSAWQKTLTNALLDVGFLQSKYDPCLFYMREGERLTGIYGVHVDDCATGGSGTKYEQALEELKCKFEFRKWRLDDGEFCGARYIQDPSTGCISMTQQKFCEKLHPLRMSRARQAEKESPLTPEEVRCLRAINGGLNWLSSQSRPDLSTQVSFSQQSFPQPRVSDALAANLAIRRAKQYAELPLVFHPIPAENLAVMGHSDAAYANGRDGATQAGYLVSFTDKTVNDGQVRSWSPAFWRSYRLPRVVNSTLSAEAQAMTAATGMLEWVQLLLSEALDGHQCLRASWSSERQRASAILTDCKSLYDHLVSKSSPTLDDKRTALDVVIIRESLAKMKASLRWIPTDRMLADALTKESAEAMDLLRACIRTGRYQISDEDTVLEWRASERARRKSQSTDNADATR